MRGIPKIIGTGKDIDNIVEMFQNGELDENDKPIFIQKLRAIINTETHNYSILKSSGKDVTIGYTGNEIKINTLINDNYATIKDINHNEDKSVKGEFPVYTSTTLTLSKELLETDKFIKVVPESMTKFKQIGKTKKELLDIIEALSVTE